MIYWTVQYKIRGGWANFYSSIATSRKGAISNYIAEGFVGNWRRVQRKGKVRCIKIKIVPV